MCKVSIFVQYIFTCLLLLMHNVHEPTYIHVLNETCLLLLMSLIIKRVYFYSRIEPNEPTYIHVLNDTCLLSLTHKAQ